MAEVPSTSGEQGLALVPQPRGELDRPIQRVRQRPIVAGGHGGRQLPGRASCRCHTVTVAREEPGQQGGHDKRELGPDAGVEVVLVSPQNVMQLTPDLVQRDGDHGRYRAGDLSVGLSATEAAPIAGVRCPVADIANPGGDQGHGDEVARRRVG